tara:strand:- start:2987 stop:3208 length:222 start_codon:yes stop_codon:yes gene_type:complete
LFFAKKILIKRKRKKKKEKEESLLCGYNNRDVVLLYVYTAYHIKIFVDDMYINYFLVSQVDRSIDRSSVAQSE